MAWGLSACPSLDNPKASFPAPDYGVFVTDVQPIVAQRCSSAACHGDPHRSLKLYAVDFLRAPPDFAETPLDEKFLTDSELAWNYDELRSRLRGVTRVDHCELLLKTLPQTQGGVHHANGIAVFFSATDPDYKILRDWVSGSLP